MFPRFDLLLACSLGILAIIMYLLPSKTPLTIVVLLLIAFGLSFYIIWTFPWLKESLGRRLAGLFCVAACLCLFGDYIWLRDKLISEAQHMKLIKQWRDGIESISDSEWYQHSMGSTLFRDEVWYSSLRQYMNTESIEKLEKPRTLIVPSDSGGQIPKKVILLDEVARIEKEWGLTGHSKRNY
jgi:hypothetical protein